jgi:hypothetical protein
MLVYSLIYTSTLKMEVALPSETSSDFQRTLHKHSCEHLKSYTDMN